MADGGAGTATTATDRDSGYLRVFVFALFFFFGGITSLNDVIIPRLKELFTLSYAEVMTVQSAFFGAYFIISLPAAAVVRRIGYMRSAVVGLSLMMIGCLLFIPACSSALFEMFLVALFIVAAGITIVQVVANPLISRLGPPATVHSRLTFAQAFNSLGTTIFPYVGSALILGSLTTIDSKSLTGAALQSYRAQATHVIGATYLGLALTLLVLAIMVWSYRDHLSEHRVSGSGWREALGLLAGAEIHLRGGLHLSLCGRGGCDRLADCQLSDADGRPGAGPTSGWRARAALLGWRNGRALYRLVPASLVLAGKGTRCGSGGSHDAAVHLFAYDRSSVWVGAACDRALQLDHVSYHLFVGVRGSRSALRLCLRHYRGGHRRRRRDPTVDRSHRRCVQPENCPLSAGDLPRRHPGVRHLRATAGGCGRNRAGLRGIVSHGAWRRELYL